MTTTVTSVSAGDDGAVATVDVSSQGWSTGSALQIDAAITVPQVLDSGVGTATGVILSTATVDAETPTAESALDPVETSPGIEYSFRTPWAGAETNSLNFCHEFTVTNTTATTLTDWWITFDTTLAPMWGMDPTEDGAVVSTTLRTLEFNRSSGLWTIGAVDGWFNTIEPYSSRVVQFCARNVPMPTPDPSLFDARVTADVQDNGNATLSIAVTSASEFYVPWQVEMDLADLVCADALGDHTVQFWGQVAAAPVEGSTTRYVVEGSGGTELVSATNPRNFTLGTFQPDPDWQGGTCEAGG